MSEIEMPQTGRTRKPAGGGVGRYAWVGIHAVGIGILCWLLAGVDWGRLWGDLAAAKAREMVISLLLFLCLMSVKSLRFAYLIRGEGVHLPFTEILRVYLACYAIGTVTPGRVGEMAKAVYLKRRAGQTLAGAMVPVTQDRAYDLLFLCTFGVVGWTAVGLLDSYGSAGRWFIMAAVIALLAASPLIGARVCAIFANRCKAGSRAGRLFLWCENVLVGFLSVRGLLAFGLTSVAYLLGFVMAYAVATAVGVSSSFAYFCVAMISISLAQLLPISIGGFGTREAAAVSLLAGTGNSEEQVLAFSFLYFSVMYIWGGLCGLIAYLTLPKAWIRKQGPG